MLFICSIGGRLVRENAMEMEAGAYRVGGWDVTGRQKSEGTSRAPFSEMGGQSRAVLRFVLLVGAVILSGAAL